MFTITAARRLNRRIAGVSLGAALIVVGAVGAQSFADGGEAGDSPPPPPGAEIAPEEPQPSPVAGGENTLIQTTGATFDETVLTKFMPAAAFQPLQSALDLDLDAVSLNGEGCVSPLTTASSGSTARLLAPVELPDGGGREPATFSIEKVEGWKGGDWPEIWFESDRLDDLTAELKAKGGKFESEPETMSYLWRVAHLRDPAGNRITLYHAGENRLNPPWRLK